MRGLSWRSAAVVLATMSTYARADVVLTPSNTSQYSHESFSSTLIQIALPDSSSSMKGFATVIPLFMSGFTELHPWELSDPLLHVNPTFPSNTSRAWIAYISCDQSAYPGFQGASAALTTALNINVTAVLLYSTSSNYCNVTSLDSSYPYIYTMTNTTDSQQLLDKIDANTHLQGLISFADQVRNETNSTASSSSSTQGTSNTGLGGSPTTAVAMIILYSITGIITALFLVIILTGAIRAHRHPERYGPRNILGRPRQSRARGVGRAILDTIPIVKFGEREPPKETDVEMAGSSHGVPVQAAAGHEATVAALTSTSGDATQQPRVSTSSARSGIAPAIAATSDSPAEHNDDDAPSCSICTEDFEMGEDLRVLPCDHMFHPACIDPWLLNVSGTCPLCRIDLNPTRTRDSAEGQTENHDLPPPIEGEQPTSRPRVGMRQSFLIGLGLGHVHDATREERITAVRRLREQERLWNEERRASIRSAALVADENSRRRRFRERFGIRTRQRGQEDENRQESENRPESGNREAANNA